MASAENQKEPEKIHRQQLGNRLHLLAVLKEFRQKAGYQEEAAEEDEQLSERILGQQEKLDKTLSDDPLRVTQQRSPVSNEIFIVERPPAFPAPQVITDMEKLPRHSALIQCPYCEQFVLTEVSAVIGNTAWLVCLVCSFLCCIAGCCLVPFCVGTFKDVMHRCPKCRSSLHTCTSM